MFCVEQPLFSEKSPFPKIYLSLTPGNHHMYQTGHESIPFPMTFENRKFELSRAWHSGHSLPILYLVLLLEVESGKASVAIVVSTRIARRILLSL